MATISCPNCGRLVRDTDIRCLYCNTPLTSSPPEKQDYIQNKEVATYGKSFGAANSDSPNSFSDRPRVETETQEYANDTVTVRTTKTFTEHNVHLVSSETGMDEVLKELTLNENQNTKRGVSIQVHRNTTKPKKNNVLKIIIVIVLSMVALIGGTALYQELEYLVWDREHLDVGYYINNNNELFYFDDYIYVADEHSEISRWWKFNTTTGDWVIYKEFPYEESETLFNFTDSDCLWEHEAAEKLHLDESVINIRFSKAFIDAGHHYQPLTGYYWLDDIAYFYLHYYETDEISNWYIFSPENGWQFYCDNEDKDKLGEVLYYFPDFAYVGNDDGAWQRRGVEAPDSFLKTEWHLAYQAAEEEFRRKYG